MSMDLKTFNKNSILLIAVLLIIQGLTTLLGIKIGVYVFLLLLIIISFTSGVNLRKTLIKEE